MNWKVVNVFLSLTLVPLSIVTGWLLWSWFIGEVSVLNYIGITTLIGFIYFMCSKSTTYNVSLLKVMLVDVFQSAEEKAWTTACGLMAYHVVCLFCLGLGYVVHLFA